MPAPVTTPSLKCGDPLVRDVLSLKEAIVLASVQEDRVRKDMENGVFISAKVQHRNFVRWVDVFTLAAIYSDHHLSRELRRAAFEKIEWTFKRAFVETKVPTTPVPAETFEHWVCHGIDSWATKIELSKFVFVDIGSVVAEYRPRVKLYAAGLAKITEDPNIANGAAVFKGTRLSVRHVGLMLRNGEPASDVLEDYPYLSKADLDFAAIYADAHPITGRPRKTGGDPNAEVAAG